LAREGGPHRRRLKFQRLLISREVEEHGRAPCGAALSPDSGARVKESSGLLISRSAAPWFFGNQVSATRPFEEAVHAPREWKPLPQRGATKPLLPIDSALSRRGFNFFGKAESEEQNPESRIQNPEENKIRKICRSGFHLLILNSGF